MTVGQQREPLRVLSSSRINQLGSKSQLHEKRIEKLKLPSITSIIETEAPAASEKHSIDSRSKESFKNIEFPISSMDSYAVATGSPQYSSESIQQQSGPTDYEEISKRLRVRLQFAYYKYKTNQTHLKFKQLHHKNPERSPLTSNRRLVGSRGNYRTPVKHKSWHARDISCQTVPAPQQNTPMSVKAAKSLLQLFTSVP